MTKFGLFMLKIVILSILFKKTDTEPQTNQKLTGREHEALYKRVGV